MVNETLSGVPGLQVGHWSDMDAATGCTVILTPDGATAAIDIRGAAPGSRETALLGPGKLVHKVHGVLLTGGSAFGLAAADGVVAWLEEKGIGMPVGELRIPIVPAAVLFDLGIGRPDRRPNADSGYEACKAASTKPVLEGSVGAGTGAVVGKGLGIRQGMKGGIGSVAAALPGGASIGVLVAVNAFGDVVDTTTGDVVAGAWRQDGGEFAGTEKMAVDGEFRQAFTGTNTTLGLVATDAAFSRDELKILASMTHAAFPRAIRPAHTLVDGDIVFALSTGSRPADLMTAGTTAAVLMEKAILRAVREATSVHGIKACAS